MSEVDLERTWRTVRAALRKAPGTIAGLALRTGLTQEQVKAGLDALASVQQASCSANVWKLGL